MFIQFSVIIAFSTLFIASVFDVKSQKGDVPEIILFTGIASGLTLHLIYSIVNWSSSAITWSLGAGFAFGLYGYFAYRRGMWGGADFLGLLILGVSTPYFLGVIGIFDLIVNTMMTGFLYAAGFGIYGGVKSEEVRQDFRQRVREEKKYIGAGLLLTAVFSSFAYSQGLNGFLYFGAFSFMIFLYYFMTSVEEKMMVRTVDASKVEEGDVLAEGEIKGVEAEELEGLEGDVELKKGIRFMPVFPVGLALTVAGVSVLRFLVGVF